MCLNVKVAELKDLKDKTLLGLMYTVAGKPMYRSIWSFFFSEAPELSSMLSYMYTLAFIVV